MIHICLLKHAARRHSTPVYRRVAVYRHVAVYRRVAALTTTSYRRRSACSRPGSRAWAGCARRLGDPSIVAAQWHYNNGMALNGTAA